MLNFIVVTIVIGLAFCGDFQKPNWEDKVKYSFYGKNLKKFTKTHEVYGEFIFNFEDEQFDTKGFKLKLQDQNFQNGGEFKLRTKQFYTAAKRITEVWYENNTVLCEKIDKPIKPFEISPCKEGKYDGTEVITLENGKSSFVNVWKNCNFDGYLTNFFPHSPIGNHYTFFTSIFNPNQVLRIIAGEDQPEAYIDMLEHVILDQYFIKMEFADPQIEC